MNYQEECINAHKILGLSITNNIDERMLRRNYYKEALRYHPDTSKLPDSKAKFQEINDAYIFACKYHGFIDEEEPYDDVDPTDNNDYKPNVFMNYTKNIYQYLSPFVENDLFQDVTVRVLHSIINNICNKCETKSLEILEKMNMNQCNKICKILRMQQDVLNISDTFIKKMEILCKTKSSIDECIKIYPSIDDLYSDNLYKLKEGVNTYYVPVWYHELVYDNSGTDLYVQCIPKLDEGIEIDDKNDIHIIKQCILTDLWNKCDIVIRLGNKTINLPVDKLKITKQQTVKIVGEGISRMNSSNIYDISKKSNVYVYLNIIE
jgi:hypothetical protein